jgi:hypothetical protein
MELYYLPVSLGEAIDKLSILDIKLDKITDSRRNNIKIEYDMLYEKLKVDVEKYTLYYNIIKIINLEIWDMMNILRDSEEYNDDYMKLCRECMILNDVRFRIKSKINYISNCCLKEQKGYKVTRVLFDIRNTQLNFKNLILPIQYYSFFYDEINILTDESELFKNHFSYDPTININNNDNNDNDTNFTYKKIFDLKQYAYTNDDNLYKKLEIKNEDMNKFFTCLHN